MIYWICQYSKNFSKITLNMPYKKRNCRKKGVITAVSEEEEENEWNYFFLLCNNYNPENSRSKKSKVFRLQR